MLGKEEDAVDGFAAVMASHLDLDEVALTAAASFNIQSQIGDGSSKPLLSLPAFVASAGGSISPDLLYTPA